MKYSSRPLKCDSSDMEKFCNMHKNKLVAACYVDMADGLLAIISMSLELGV